MDFILPSILVLGAILLSLKNNGCLTLKKYIK